MPGWRYLGSSFGDRATGDRAIFIRELEDGVRLQATVKTTGGRPVVEEITATFPDGARDFGRELAISELEQVINESDRHGVMTADGTIVPILSITDFPVGVPVKGSRGRAPEWTDVRLAQLVRDIETDTTDRWHLQWGTIRQHANTAVHRGIAEPAPKAGATKRWRLTDHGRALLND